MNVNFVFILFFLFHRICSSLVALIVPVPDPKGRRPSRHVELAGAAYSPDGFAEKEELFWSSNIQGYLGIGSHLIGNNLIPGEHLISLVAPDGMGGETRAEYRVRVLPDDVPS